MSDTLPLPPCPCCRSLMYTWTVGDGGVCCTKCAYAANKDDHIALCAKLAALEKCKEALKDILGVHTDEEMAELEKGLAMIPDSEPNKVVALKAVSIFKAAEAVK